MFTVLAYYTKGFGFDSNRCHTNTRIKNNASCFAGSFQDLLLNVGRSLRNFSFGKGSAL
jgi:hypothetical protein